MKLYLIAGLGYDKRIFKNLNVEGFDVEYLDWIEPKKNETLHDYAQRFFPTNDAEKSVIIGHSLGGIAAQEIATIYKIEKIILISSVRSRSEIPYYFKVIKPLGLEVFFRRKWCMKTVKFWGSRHEFTTEEDQELFKDMIGNQTNNYLQWALRKVSGWRAPSVPAHTEIVQIHGTRDRTFPFGKIRQPDFTVENGSHIMVYKEPDKISSLIRNILQKK